MTSVFCPTIVMIVHMNIVSTPPIAKYYICQKCEGICGLCVLKEIIKKIYPENMKKNKKSLVLFRSLLQENGLIFTKDSGSKFRVIKKF